MVQAVVKVEAMRCSLALLLLSALGQAAADCESDIQEYIQGLDPTQPQLWSLEMLDSSVKYPQAGFFEGTFIIQLGNYDQCLAIRGPNDESGTPRFKGQYCHFNFGFQSPGLELVNDDLQKVLEFRKISGEIFHLGRFAQTVKLPFKWAVCAPSSCGVDGVKTIADINMAALSNVFTVDANSSVDPNSCYFEGDDSKNFETNTWCFVAFAIILALWICFSSVYELLNPNFDNEGWKILVRSFSLQTNFGDLLKLPSNPAAGQLGCLHGIRVLSMMWIIFAHAYGYFVQFPAVNFVSHLLKIGNDWKMAPLFNGYVSVDTFLFLSGLLVVYVPLIENAKGRKFSIWKYYIYRFLRITPAFAAFIWYLTSLNVYMGHGPLWHVTVETSRRICLENWWPALLYVANYLPLPYCIAQSWYLFVDMQLALLAPIVIIPLIKWPKYGLGLIAVLTCACLGALFGITYVKSYPWTYINKIGYNNGNYIRDVYISTPFRAVPYLVGMALGYLLSKKVKIELPKWAVTLGWFLSTTICLTIIYIVVIPYSDNYVYEPVGASFYASLHKLGWGLGLAWIVWACVNGYGGPVNSILSNKLFLPLSKISFAVFLVHNDFLVFHQGHQRALNFISNFEIFYLFFGTLVLCLPLGVVLYIAVEAPIVNILRSVFKKASRNEPMITKLQKEN